LTAQRIVPWDPLSGRVRLTPTADIVAGHDIAGIITDCNEVAANLLGYPRSRSPVSR
jgi:PAS domain-containing protein